MVASYYCRFHPMMTAALEIEIAGCARPIALPMIVSAPPLLRATESKIWPIASP
jgi:hypothetical protein